MALAAANVGVTVLEMPGEILNRGFPGITVEFTAIENSASLFQNNCVFSSTCFVPQKTRPHWT